MRQFLYLRCAFLIPTPVKVYFVFYTLCNSNPDTGNARFYVNNNTSLHLRQNILERVFNMNRKKGKFITTQHGRRGILSSSRLQTWHGKTPVELNETDSEAEEESYFL